MSDILSEVRRASLAAQRATANAEAARARRDALIRRARDEGMSLREIAAAAGISLQRVEQIVLDGR